MPPNKVRGAGEVSGASKIPASSEGHQGSTPRETNTTRRAGGSGELGETRDSDTGRATDQARHSSVTRPESSREWSGSRAENTSARTGDAASPSTVRRAETRRRLVEAAHEVFNEQGIRDASVELICQRAGFSRGAFYSNFETKEQLFLALLVEEAQGRTERLRQAIAENIDPSGVSDEASLRASVLQLCELCAEPLVADRNWYMLLTEFRAHALRQPEMRAHARIEFDRLADDVGQVLLETLDQLGMRLTVPVREAVYTIGALAEAAIARASFAELDSVAKTSFMADVLPRLAATLVEPCPTGQ